MSPATLFVFFLSLLCLVLASPVKKDLEVSDTGLLSDGAIGSKVVLSPTLEQTVVRVRAKRDTMRPRSTCPRGRIYYLERCMSRKRYERLTQGDYEK